MAEATSHTSNLIAKKRPKVDMFKNELDARNTLIETIAFGREQTLITALFTTRQNEKSYEKRECNKNEDEVCHGVWVAIRAKRLTSTRSPNFCVASFRRFRTVLLSSLING